MTHSSSRNAVAPLTPPNDRTVASSVRKERVLIVDNELPVRALLTRMLKPWGYRTMHAGNVVDALTIMRQEPADILLCDVEMPEQDGVWLIEQVRARWPQTAVIMSTWHDAGYAVRRSRQLGAVAYVTKPLIPELLHEALGRAAAQTLH